MSSQFLFTPLFSFVPLDPNGFRLVCGPLSVCVESLNDVLSAKNFFPRLSDLLSNAPNVFPEAIKQAYELLKTRYIS